ncbi:hypothetical protein I79_002138 [Cricetulus griseus]|uniref:Secreted protein n=1 Tax=Cricetulus griseus TaxID=10029 RepID=G3GWL1_CRIGR|nr:hypothetical protein I79_002138 [Cricetulus griseus]
MRPFPQLLTATGLPTVSLCLFLMGSRPGHFFYGGRGNRKGAGLDHLWVSSPPCLCPSPAKWLLSLSDGKHHLILMAI